MKVLVLAFPSGAQFRLMFDHEVPTLPDMSGEFTEVCLADDYGQSVRFPNCMMPAICVQDTAQLDRLEIAMMVRQKTNEIAAMQQLQSNPSNMIVHPGRGLIS